MLAHVGGFPAEELAPFAGAAGVWLLAVRAWLAASHHRRRDERRAGRDTPDVNVAASDPGRSTDAG